MFGLKQITDDFHASTHYSVSNESWTRSIPFYQQMPKYPRYIYSACERVWHPSWQIDSIVNLGNSPSIFWLIIQGYHVGLGYQGRDTMWGIYACSLSSITYLSMPWPSAKSEWKAHPLFSDRWILFFLRFVSVLNQKHVPGGDMFVADESGNLSRKVFMLARTVWCGHRYFHDRTIQIEFCWIVV